MDSDELNNIKSYSLAFVANINEPTKVTFFPLAEGDLVYDAANSLCSIEAGDVVFRNRTVLPNLLHDLSFTFNYDWLLSNRADWNYVKNILDMPHLSDGEMKNIILNLVKNTLPEEFWEMRGIYGRPF